MLHVISGATGNIGGRVAEQLLELGHRPRLFVRDAAAARSRFADQVDLAVGDLSDGTGLERALEGADTLFLTNSGPDLGRQDALAVQAAKQAGVKRVVKLSALGARAAGQTTAVAQWHAEGERAIQASGVPYTFVQPVGFMSNALAWASSIRGAGVVRASTGEGRIAMIHPEDIARVIVVALSTQQHEGQSLPITGPEALSYREMTSKLAAALGRPLAFEAISDEQAREHLRVLGLPSELIRALVTLWAEVREGLVSLVTGEVERVTGRAPIAFDQWAREHAAAF